MSLLQKSKLQKREEGFTTAWMIGLALLIILVGLFFFDIGRAFSQRQKLVIAADRAANSGATALDESLLVSSDGAQVRLDQVQAEQRCRDVFIDEASGQAQGVINEGNSSCNVAADGSSITVTARGSVRFNSMVAWVGGIESRNFEVTSRARPSCSDALDPVSGGCP